MDFVRCENCVHFVSTGESGECHVDGPLRPTAGSTARWPQVLPEESCGRFAFNAGPVLAELHSLRVRVRDLEYENDGLRGDMATTQMLYDAARADLTKPEGDR